MHMCVDGVYMIADISAIPHEFKAERGYVLIYDNNKV